MRFRMTCIRFIVSDEAAELLSKLQRKKKVKPILSWCLGGLIPLFPRCDEQRVHFVLFFFTSSSVPFAIYGFVFWCNFFCVIDEKRTRYTNQNTIRWHRHLIFRCLSFPQFNLCTITGSNIAYCIMRTDGQFTSGFQVSMSSHSQSDAHRLSTVSCNATISNITTSI